MTVTVARSFRERLLGFMFRNPRGRGGLFFPRCGAVHTSFVLGPLDILFLDEANRVLKVAEGVRPFRILWVWGASSVLELPGGDWEGLGEGGKSTLLSSLPLPNSR